ncbi:hypothetical protein GCM10022406_16770 [Hymenobacter algoricola]|uniref:Uncharacterized protein n=1 Tax=Hymenobacter algoricola TaxID=486267 RepID=A0ABP7MYD2_9BACT
MSAQNIGLLTLSSALGAAAVQGGTHLLQQVTQGGSDLDLVRAAMHQLRQELQAAKVLPQPVSVLSYLPEELQLATTPVVMLPLGTSTVSAVRVRYHGHILYHNEGQQLLVWEERPGTYHHIRNEQQLVQLADKPAHDRRPTVALPSAGAAGELVLDLGALSQPEQTLSTTAAERAFDAALFAPLAPEAFRGPDRS